MKSEDNCSDNRVHFATSPTCRFRTLSETFSCDMLWSRSGSVPGSSGMKMLSCERARDPMGFNSLQKNESAFSVAACHYCQSFIHSFPMSGLRRRSLNHITKKWMTSLHTSSVSTSIKGSNRAESFIGCISAEPHPFSLQTVWARLLWESVWTLSFLWKESVKKPRCFFTSTLTVCITTSLHRPHITDKTSGISNKKTTRVKGQFHYV